MPEEAGKQKRLLPIDALRGLIIVLMALDHANYFIAQQHSLGEHWGGPFPLYFDGLSFLTRFVTHLSAPGFFFLMGVGMYLFAKKRARAGWSHRAVISHFFVRGGFLVVLQLLLINRLWELGPLPFPSIYIGVLIALGGTMILGSFLLGVQERLLIILTLILFVGTELLHPNPALWQQLSNDAANLLLLRSGGDGVFWSNYPILPWLELVIFGIVFGIWLLADSRRAYRRALILSLSFLLAFIGLRMIGGFGNIRPPESHDWIGFLNVVKYPPAMTFTLLTMSINLFILWCFARLGELGNKILQPLSVFGRAPLFVYMAHLALFMLFGRLGAPSGTSLGVMYIAWLVGLGILYPLTLWFGELKSSRPPNSILRFL